MNPFDVDTDWGHKLAQHIPLLGMVAARVQEHIRTPVEFWHLIVAVVGMCVLLGTTFGGIIWNEARTQAELAEQLKQVRRDNDVQDAVTAYIRRRQEINEERLNKLETESALSKEFDARMIREHADIYQAIRGKANR